MNEPEAGPPDRSRHADRRPECVILIGLQGAGKTTFYRQRFSATHALISKDLWPNARRREERLRQALAAALSRGRSVVLDNTHPAPSDRIPLIELAHAYGARVVGYHLEATPAEAVARNATREGRARVPKVAIFATAKRFTPPSLVEGYDELHRVSFDGSGGFREVRVDAAREPFAGGTFEHGGSRLAYQVWTPPVGTAALREPPPAIVFLHGAGECGTDGRRQVSVGLGPELLRRPDRWPFVVILPQKPRVEEPWEGHTDAVLALIDLVSRDRSLDPARVYLTGISQGGHGTWELAASQPARWAAIVPVCGFGVPSRYARALVNMPVWAFHGDQDTIVPPEASVGIVDAIRAACGSPRLTMYSGVGHESWERAYREPELPAWLLSHARDERGVRT